MAKQTQNENFEKSPLIMKALEMMGEGFTFDDAIKNAHNHFAKLNYDMYANNKNGKRIKEVIANRVWLKINC